MTINLEQLAYLNKGIFKLVEISIAQLESFPDLSKQVIPMDESFFMLMHPGSPRPLYQVKEFNTEDVMEALDAWKLDPHSKYNHLYKGLRIVESPQVRAVMRHDGILDEQVYNSLVDQISNMSSIMSNEETR
jgi:hypothetical protein